MFTLAGIADTTGLITAGGGGFIGGVAIVRGVEMGTDSATGVVDDDGTLASEDTVVALGPFKT